ncbi:MAG: hypothetical protein AAF591_22400 [Verrucomicrobiota bacterium]
MSEPSLEPDVESVVESIDPATAANGSFQERVKAARRILVALEARYETAARGGGDISQEARHYHQLFDSLRKAEESAPKMRIQEGLAWDIAEANEELLAVNSAIRKGHERLIEKWATAKKRPTQEQMLEDLDELQEFWKETRFEIVGGAK